MDRDDLLNYLRRRVEDLESLIAGDGGEDERGQRILLARTKSLGAYPTVAQKFYACNSVRISGREGENQAVTLLDNDDTLFFANLGASVPPAGTALVITHVPDRWAARYDGQQ